MRGRSGERVQELVREALRRGPLVREGRHWRFGARSFANETVRRAIDDGAAVQRDNEVVRA